MTFFTSDTHWGHTNIIKYCKRPFASCKEMDACLIENWNSVVTPQDSVWHLGDFCFGEVYQAKEYIEQLNGHINFVWGNHDRAMWLLQRELQRFPDNNISKKISFEGDIAGDKIGEHSVVLCHYAMRVWNKSHYNAWQLYGHSHGTLAEDPKLLSFDIGVDCWNFMPISADMVAEKLKKKEALLKKECSVLL